MSTTASADAAIRPRQPKDQAPNGLEYNSVGYDARLEGARAAPYMRWTEPKFSNGKRNEAGRNLALGGASALDFEIINNWRSSHSAPLQTVKMLLKGRAQSVYPKAIIAQRLKRLPSIQAKLEREPTMRLTQMQDIGGCRAVMNSIKQVRVLQKKFSESMAKNPSRHGSRKPKDYISDPKPDGYRSVHFVLRYLSESPHLACFNGHLVEVQLRSRLQHAWATALEIVDVLTGQSLKTSLKSKLGDADWKRFFQLMGSAMAIREGCPLVANTPTSMPELRDELVYYNRLLGVGALLSGFGAAVNMSKDLMDYCEAYILELNTKSNRTTVYGFGEDELEEADELYSTLELQYADDDSVQVVQVQVENVEMLRVAYPNFYLDTTHFVGALESVIR